MYRKRLPHQIEEESFAIIGRELGDRVFEAGTEAIVKRVIHTSADFDYADNLVFTPGVVARAHALLKQGAAIVCDTNMAKAGINKAALQQLGGSAHCFIADDDVAAKARQNGTTRAVAAMEKAVERFRERPALFVVGNAPTALLRLLEMGEQGGFAPQLVIGVPVGFVNVVESKERLLASGLPAIVARGRKGGSNIAAAICNALLYALVR